MPFRNIASGAAGSQPGGGKEQRRRAIPFHGALFSMHRWGLVVSFIETYCLVVDESSS